MTLYMLGQRWTWKKISSFFYYLDVMLLRVTAAVAAQQ